MAAAEQWIADCCLASASEASPGCFAQPDPDIMDPVTIEDHRLNGLYGRDDYLDASSSSTPDTIRDSPSPAAAWSGPRRVTLTRTNARQDKNFRPPPAPPVNVEPYRSHHNSPSSSPHSFPGWRSKNLPLPGREHVGGGVCMDGFQSHSGIIKGEEVMQQWRNGNVKCFRMTIVCSAEPIAFFINHDQPKIAPAGPAGTPYCPVTPPHSSLWSRILPAPSRYSARRSCPRCLPPTVFVSP